jgi:hypothetical protein
MGYRQCQDRTVVTEVLMVNNKVNYLYGVLVEVDSQMEWRPTWLRRSWWLGRRYARHERSAIGPGPCHPAKT